MKLVAQGPGHELDEPPGVQVGAVSRVIARMLR
jgi:hypothetical protein